MSLRSIISTALRGIAAAARATGRAAAFTAKAVAVPAVWTVRAVVDTATGAVRFVREMLAPSVPVLPAQAQADAYLDAAESAPLAPSPELDRFAAAHPGLVEEARRREFPEAALLQAFVKHVAWGGPGFPRPDMTKVPERVMLWLTSLDDAAAERVLHASLPRLDMHLRAKCEADLMPGVPPVLTTAEARADAAARREREVESLARKSGAGRARAADPEQAELDALVEAAEEAGPSPRPF